MYIYQLYIYLLFIETHSYKRVAFNREKTYCHVNLAQKLGTGRCTCTLCFEESSDRSTLSVMLVNIAI